MTIDPYILAFSAITVIVTVWMGFRSAKQSKTASDFFVAGRSVGVGMNASAISGEYLSAASFMGVAGMVMSSGYDALWYPVCYACGYLFLLLFIAGPLRRFGAYTIPDFAEGRFDSPLFRKIAVVFVLFIGFFYTMPQMKGAGTTLAYIFPGLPYWAGVVLVGAVITLNVALGGMKGITLVQAFQYWIKMFAISVPIFVLMAVYGGYGKQVGLNHSLASQVSSLALATNAPAATAFLKNPNESILVSLAAQEVAPKTLAFAPGVTIRVGDGVEVVGTVLYDGKAQTFKLRTNASTTVTDGLRRLAPAFRDLVDGFGWIAPEKKGTAVPVRFSVEHLFERVEFPASRGLAMVEKSIKSVADKIGASGPPASLLPGATVRMKDMLHACLQNRSQNNRVILYYAAELYEKTVSAPTNRVLALQSLGDFFATNGVAVVWESEEVVKVYPTATSDVFVPVQIPEVATAITRAPLPEKAPADATWLNPFGPLTTKAAKAAKLSPEESKPYSLLYTYSLIIAIVCGTAGLPHILVRFYTNPDGVAAKRTTMWVMILIGVFYVFPPVFGVIGRNLLPELYSGVGAKGTDKIVLELPRIISERYGVLGSILSGITCAGAFAAFMSTFSGLLVSMTGALAHDVYGRMLNPKASAEQRMKMFKWCAVLIGGVAVLLGSFVEPLEINFMVGQAFAIAAASYFPLLFMAVWWRKLTMKGAATGMLTGGLSALVGISLTSFSTLASAPGKTGELFALFKPLNDFWATHPLLRILCEQPAIWAVPLAIILMIVVSKLTSKDVPEDIRMKMLVLHAPEKLGLKQEYIQEHQPGH